MVQVQNSNVKDKGQRSNACNAPTATCSSCLQYSSHFQRQGLGQGHFPKPLPAPATAPSSQPSQTRANQQAPAFSHCHSHSQSQSQCQSQRRYSSSQGPHNLCFVWSKQRMAKPISEDRGGCPPVYHHPSEWSSTTRGLAKAAQHMVERILV